MTVRPLEDIVGVDLSRFGAAPEKLLELPKVAAYGRAKAFFADYPTQSLANPESRAFMNCLVRALRPELFIEIGTYFADTTEVVARAMLNNGNGRQLLTIDPYGNHRVPGILESWPAPLREIVSYMPVESMTLFARLAAARPVVDVCFIDGDHKYEFAGYDLNCLAQWMRPGGIIIMDDYDQPGVYWATKHFLQLNPGWRELSGVFDDFDVNAPFESLRPSVEGTGFLVLAAPDTIEVGEKPSVFEIGEIKAIELTGLTLPLAPDNAAGTLHALVFFRSFCFEDSDGEPEQLEIRCAAPVSDGGGEQMVMFDAPLIPSGDD